MMFLPFRHSKPGRRIEPNRHPELVSGSIPSLPSLSQGQPWTLKQVQGDEGGMWQAVMSGDRS